MFLHHISRRLLVNELDSMLVDIHTVLTECHYKVF